MNDIGWSAPQRPVDAGTARRGILWQHERIRTLLEKALALADARLGGEPLVPDAVASAIGDIHAAMEIHLTFEEAVLLPLLRDDLPVGPQRADRLVAEHIQQRATLAALHKEASMHPELPLLASKLAALTSWLLADMVEEECSLLNPDAVRDDLVVVDQNSG
jgi:hypothetical protein